MQQNVLGRIHFEGRWSADALAPVQVSDVDRAAHLIRIGARVKGAIPMPRLLLSQARITALELEQLIARMRASARRELESLLSGGGLLWKEEWANLVVDAGVNYALDAALSGGTPITAWYLVPIQAAASPSSTLPTPAAADTMASHAGWAEVTAYTEAARQAWTDAGVAAKSVSNSASPAAHSINADNTYIGGAALASVSTKGGTTGTLYAAGAFGAVRTVNDGDTHRITATFNG